MAVSVFLILRRDGASMCCLLYKNFKKPSSGPVLLTITMSHYSLGLLASRSGGTEGSICHSLPLHSTWLLLHPPALALCYSHQEWRFGLVPPWHMQHLAQRGGGGRSGDKEFSGLWSKSTYCSANRCRGSCSFFCSLSPLQLSQGILLPCLQPEEPVPVQVT